MNPYHSVEERVRSADSIVSAAEALEALLIGGFAVWEDGRLYSIRQLVDKVKGLKVEVRAREHSPPHFHVVGCGIDAAFKIDECSLLAGEIDGRERRLIEWWYERSKNLLVTAWNDSRPEGFSVGPIREK